MANSTQSSGSRAAFATYHATGTAPASAAVISFTDSYGDALTTIPIGSASQITIKATNADSADDLILSYRIKLHSSEAAFTEAATTTTAQAVTEILTPYTNVDKVLGGSELQVWWNNQTGAGTTGTVVTVCVKGS